MRRAGLAASGSAVRAPARCGAKRGRGNRDFPPPLPGAASLLPAAAAERARAHRFPSGCRGCERVARARAGGDSRWLRRDPVPQLGRGNALPRCCASWKALSNGVLVGADSGERPEESQEAARVGLQVDGAEPRPLAAG